LRIKNVGNMLTATSPAACRQNILPAGQASLKTSGNNRQTKSSSTRLTAAKIQNSPQVVRPATKKRKYSESPTASLTVSSAAAAAAAADICASQFKTEPDCLSDGSDDDNASVGGTTTAQSIRWTNYQPTKWCKLLDKTRAELPTVSYSVEADKGFNFLVHDDSFVCQKKNHFQLTVRAGLARGAAVPQYVQDPESGVTTPVEGFFSALTWY
jgi:hypothetical protein